MQGGLNFREWAASAPLDYAAVRENNRVVVAGFKDIFSANR